MKIGIIGSGAIGGPLGRLWAQAGHEVILSSRHPEKLAGLAAKSGDNARVGTLEEAMQFGDVLLEAIPYHASLDLPAAALEGKILITASNYYPHRDGQIDLKGLIQTELLAKQLPGARIVKAFNMMYAAEMEARAEGRVEREIAIYYAGDDVDAKQVVDRLILEAKFEPVDAGSLADGAAFQSGGPLYAQRFTAEEAKAKLAEVKG